MRLIAIGALTACAVACATAASAQDASDPVFSWGKAGVRLEEYWLDAAECTARGAQANRDLPVALLNTGDSRQPIGMARPGSVPYDISGDSSIIALNDQINRSRLNSRQQARADQNARQDVVNACLTERGYRPFQLTAEQAERLSTLRDGSVQRRRFLHRLGSDPAVLDTQAVTLAEG